ncbi:MAG: MarR family winged helix-turn-helix transcriptional regulator [Dehalococcoidia bacterium]
MLDAAAQAMFRLGRAFARQPLRDRLTARTGRGVDLSRILVVQAVETAAAQPDGEVTVGAIAEQLGIDPSTASRLVTETIRDGYLSRGSSPTDARRVRLELTDAGRDLSASSRRYQRAVFDRVTRDWSEQERLDFARLVIKFVDSTSEVQTGRTG